MERKVSIQVEFSKTVFFSGIEVLYLETLGEEHKVFSNRTEIMDVRKLGEQE